MTARGIPESETFRPDLVPEGIWSTLKVGEVAAVMNQPVRRVQHWVKRGILRHVQPTGYAGGLQVTAASVAGYCSWAKIEPNWKALLSPDKDE